MIRITTEPRSYQGPPVFRSDLGISPPLVAFVVDGLPLSFNAVYSQVGAPLIGISEFGNTAQSDPQTSTSNAPGWNIAVPGAATPYNSVIVGYIPTTVSTTFGAGIAGSHATSGSTPTLALSGGYIAQKDATVEFIGRRALRVTSGSVLAVGEPIALATTCSAGTVAGYANGIVIGSAGATNDVNGSVFSVGHGPDTVTAGNRANPGGGVYVALYFNYVLTAKQVKTLSDIIVTAPWQLFEPQRIFIQVAAAGASFNPAWAVGSNAIVGAGAHAS